MDFRRDALLVAQFNCAKPLKALFETLALTAIEGVFEFGRELAEFHGRQTQHRIAVSIATREIEVYRYAFDEPVFRLGVEFPAVFAALGSVTDNSAVGFVVTRADVDRGTYTVYVSEHKKGTFDEFEFTNKRFKQVARSPERYTYDQVLQMTSTQFKQIVTSCKNAKTLQFLSKRLAPGVSALFYHAPMDGCTRNTMITCADAPAPGDDLMVRRPLPEPASVDDVQDPLEALGADPAAVRAAQSECDKQECFPVTALQDVARANGVAKHLRICLAVGKPLAVIYNISSVGQLSFLVLPAPDPGVMKLEELLKSRWADLPLLAGDRLLSTVPAAVQSVAGEVLGATSGADAGFDFLKSFGAPMPATMDFSIARRSRADEHAAQRDEQAPRRANGQGSSRGVPRVDFCPAADDQRAVAELAALVSESSEPPRGTRVPVRARKVAPGRRNHRLDLAASAAKRPFRSAIDMAALFAPVTKTVLCAQSE